MENVEAVDNYSLPPKGGKNSGIFRNRQERVVHIKSKNIHRLKLREASSACGSCGQLLFQEIFADFMHVSCPHSYQQITLYAFFL